MKAAAPIGNTGTLRSGPRKTPNVVKLFLARDIAKTAKTPPRSPHEEQKTEGEEGKKKKKNWTATFTSANYLEPSRPRPFRAARVGCRGDPPPPLTLVSSPLPAQQRKMAAPVAKPTPEAQFLGSRRNMAFAHSMPFLRTPSEKVTSQVRAVPPK